nr:MAG TPA: hypothetical protein [Caudoviricetes sp.]
MTCSHLSRCIFGIFVYYTLLLTLSTHICNIFFIPFNFMLQI